MQPRHCDSACKKKTKTHAHLILKWLYCDGDGHNDDAVSKATPCVTPRPLQRSLHCHARVTPWSLQGHLNATSMAMSRSLQCRSMMSPHCHSQDTRGSLHGSLQWGQVMVIAGSLMGHCKGHVRVASGSFQWSLQCVTSRSLQVSLHVHSNVAPRSRHVSLHAHPRGYSKATTTTTTTTTTAAVQSSHDFRGFKVLTQLQSRRLQGADTAAAAWSNADPAPWG